MTTCFGHCGPSSGHKKYNEKKLYSVRTNDLTLYSFSSLYIFVTWGWPTVAETCCHLIKQIQRQVRFEVPTPFQMCIKHNGGDASKDYKAILSQDLITQEVTTNRGVEICIHAFVNSAKQRHKRPASDFRSFPSVQSQTLPDCTVVMTHYSRS